MWSYNYLCSDELYHYGVLGMKWGVRKSRSSSGTTKRNRRRVDPSTLDDDELRRRNNRLESAQKYKNLTSRPSSMQKTKTVLDASADIVNQTRQINRGLANSSRAKKSQPLDLSKMSDQELQSKINREQLERRYNDLFNDNQATVSKGQQRLSTVLDVAGGVLAIGSSSVALALAIKGLK